MEERPLGLVLTGLEGEGDEGCDGWETTGGVCVVGTIDPTSAGSGTGTGSGTFGSSPFLPFFGFFS